MKYHIITIDNKEFDTDCISCSLAKHEIEPLGGYVAETKHFQVTQDTELPILGFMILNSIRHFQGMGDFTKEEQLDFIDLATRTRKAMRDVLGIQQVTLVQEERTSNSHFHLWLFPWHDWMKKIGDGTTALRPIMEYARANLKTPENLKKIEEGATTIKESLEKKK